MEKKRRIWNLRRCHPSTKWLARVHHVVVFNTKVLHFKIENTPIKDTNGKRKFKRMLSFLFVDKRKLFAMKLSFEEFNIVLHRRRIGALGLFWTNQGSKVSEDTWGTFRTLWSKKSTFLKGNFCIYKGFMDVFYILTLAWKKNQNMFIWNWFFAMRSADLTWVNGSRIQLVLYANCFLGLTYGFLKKFFQEIKLFICHFAFITLAQNTIVRLQPQNVGFLETLQTG